MVRSGVYTALPAGERAAAHRRAAELLARDGGAPERVAEHLLATEPAGDAWVAGALTQAARAASGRGAPESAAAYLRRALAEGPAEGERVALLIELGLAEFSAGDERARGRLEAASAAAAPGPERVAAAAVLAHVLARLEECAAALAAIDDAAAHLAPGAPEHAILDEMAVGVGLLDAVTADAVEERMRRVRARADAEPAPSRDLLGVAAIVAAYTNEPAAVTAQFALRCLRAGPNTIPSPADLPWFSEATIALVWSERFHDVIPVLDAGAAHARATGDAALFSATLTYRAWATLRLGDLVAAEADAREVLETRDLPAPALWHTLAAALLIDALVEQGRLEDAEAVLAPLGEAAAAKTTQTGAVLRHARGRLRLAQRRPEEALADLRAARRVHDETFTTCRNCLSARADLALALLALGDVEGAHAAAEEDVRLARALGAPGALGVALCAAGLASSDAELLREAVAALEQAGAVVERARAQTELGALLRRNNQRIEARRMLVEALDAAHRASAQPIVERAEIELRATGAKPRRVVLTGLESLTASERRVAELAGEGLTNREIAQTLFVTARTVEGHLTNVFRKLGLSSREELGDALAAPVLHLSPTGS